MAKKNSAFAAISLFLNLLTVVSIILALLPGLVNNLPHDMYLAKADMSTLTTDVIRLLHIDPEAAKNLAWNDYVLIGFWNQCYSHLARNDNDTHELTCTAASASYVFDPVSLWSSNGTAAATDLVLPTELVGTLSGHSVRKNWVKFLFVVALALCVVTVVTGSIAACSQRGSRSLGKRMLVVTASIDAIAVILLIVSSAIATAAYVGLVNSLGPAFEGVIAFSLGAGAIALLWLSVFFPLLATLSWIALLRKDRKAYARPARRAEGSGMKSMNMWNTGYSSIGGENGARERDEEEKPDNAPLLNK